jgi:acyl-CoA reductase-like NAD-dependent aldehyde dehydrogenase
MAHSGTRPTRRISGKARGSHRRKRGGISASGSLRYRKANRHGARLDLIFRRVFDRVVEGIRQRAAGIKFGAALNQESEIGPLMSEVQLNRVQHFVNDGAEVGAKILVGGKHVGDRGYFYEPTVLLNTTPAMSVQREEIFGPVLCAMPFESAEEIPPVANQTRYGLAASIWTRDVSKGARCDIILVILTEGNPLEIALFD